MRRATGILAGLLCALVLVSMPPASAAAKSWPNLIVSPQGSSWSADLRKPLFPSRLRFVPGDSASRSFYARNQSGQRARLQVVVRVTDGTRWLCCGHLRMTIAINGRSRPIKFAGPTGVGRLVLAPGETVPVKVRFRCVAPAGNDAMKRRLSFSLKLRLTELPPKAA